MPKTRNGRPISAELPGPVARSDKHAQATFAKAHDSAAEVRGHEGDAEYANRVAYSALKHSYEKVGDRWEQKDEPGPSDSRSEAGGPDPTGESFGGVDANASRKHLLDLARRLDIAGRSRMNKGELAHAIDRANQKANQKANANAGS
jgi:cation transport regulator ChaB